MEIRRKLFIALGASALAAPLISLAQQQGKVWRIGFLSQIVRPASLDGDIFGRFRQAMRKLGYIEGENLVIEWRFADDRIDNLPPLASELASMRLDAIVCGGTPAARAAKAATSTIPIVMEGGDPVGSGMVKSLSRPGGNVTGVSNINLEISPKRLEMLLGFIPTLKRVAVLTNPANANGALMVKHLQTGAQKTGVSVLTFGARSTQEIEDAFTAMVRDKAGAVIVAQDLFFIQQRRLVTETALKHKLPSISGYREFAEVGGLMSYGPDLQNHYARMAYYVDRILKGAKPADLPVEQPMEIELFINGKTAKILGLKIPQSLLIVANKVIE